MVAMMLMMQILLVFGCIAIWKEMVSVLHHYWWKPMRMRSILVKQGLDGPRPKFMLGNMNEVVTMREMALQTDMSIGDHHLLPRICPYYTQWSKIYGGMFVFWWGVEPRITVTEPHMIKEILHTKSAHFGKSEMQRKGGSVLLGNGLIMANGEDWAHRRQIVSRAFRCDKLKGMVPSMVKSTCCMLEKWAKIAPGEVDVHKHLGVLTSEIIACTAFGSSHSEGIKLFQILSSIQKLFVESNKYLWLPGSRYVPTSTNRRIWQLKKEMQHSLRTLVESRISSGTFGDDLLGLMLSANKEIMSNSSSSSSSSTSSSSSAAAAFSQAEDLIEECQTFFFVGHETTQMLITWTLMLLALNPHWQTRAREEVIQVCGGAAALDADMLSRLPTVGMIVNEVLRLYPPAPNLVRAALKDTQVGDLFIPKGSTFWIPILAIHHDTRLWGNDAHEFRPDRFSEGISRSCRNPFTDFLPFSFGPRVCVGQSFAIMESKLIVAMILHHYNLHLSPHYRHSPLSSITLKPKHGMQLLITPVPVPVPAAVAVAVAAPPAPASTAAAVS